MRPVHAHELLRNRHAEQAASRAAIEMRAWRQRSIEATRKARDVLRDAITACGVPPHQGVAILAAAESFAKAKAGEIISTQADPEPDAHANQGRTR